LLWFAFLECGKPCSHEEVVAESVDVLEGIFINVAALEQGCERAFRPSANGPGNVQM